MTQESILEIEDFGLELRGGRMLAHLSVQSWSER
jgi:hypothetical protein